MVDGKKVQMVGVLLYWGFKGLMKFGYFVNILILFVGDGNFYILEFKLFLVKVEKV